MSTESPIAQADTELQITSEVLSRGPKTLLLSPKMRRCERQFPITHLTAFIRWQSFYRTRWIRAKYILTPHVLRFIIPSKLVPLQPVSPPQSHCPLPVFFFFRFISNIFTHHSQRQLRFKSRRHTSNGHGVLDAMDRSQCFQHILTRPKTRQGKIVFSPETPVEKDRHLVQRMIIASKAGRKSC